LIIYITYVDLNIDAQQQKLNLPVKPRTARRAYSKEACENDASVLPTIPWKEPAFNLNFKRNLYSTILTEPITAM
jgi:hypothetical protein